MADPTPGVQLTPSTQAAMERIATAPATSEQGLSGVAQAVMVAATDNPIIQKDPVYRERIAAAIRAAAEHCIAVPGHHPTTEWLEGFQAARRATYEQLQGLAAELEGRDG